MTAPIGVWTSLTLTPTGNLMTSSPAYLQTLLQIGTDLMAILDFQDFCMNVMDYALSGNELNGLAN